MPTRFTKTITFKICSEKLYTVHTLRFVMYLDIVFSSRFNINTRVTVFGGITATL